MSTGKNIYKRRLAVILFFVFVWVQAAVVLYAGYSHSALSIEIQMKKNIFKLKEPVEGTIRITNMYPRFYPAVFDIKS